MVQSEYDRNPAAFETTGDTRVPREGDFYLPGHGEMQRAQSDHVWAPARVIYRPRRWWRFQWPGPQSGMSVFRATDAEHAREIADNELAAYGIPPDLGGVFQADPIDYIGRTD